MSFQRFLTASHVFLGFTKDGQYVLSYTVTVEADEHSAYPIYVYRLQWWLFLPHKPMTKVSEVRLFGEEEIQQDLYIAVCQWSTDSRKILVYGYCVPDDDEEKRQCYITITAAPPSVPCQQCLQLMENMSESLEDERGIPKRCLVHGFAVHTKYELAPPYPAFAPKTVLKIDGVVILNTGDSLIALSTELTNQQQRSIQTLFSPKPLGATSDQDEPMFGTQISSDSERPDTDAVYFDAQVQSPVGMYIDCSTDMRMNVQRKCVRQLKIPLSPAQNSHNWSNPNSPRAGSSQVPQSPGKLLMSPISPVSPKSQGRYVMSHSPCGGNGGHNAECLSYHPDKENDGNFTCSCPATNTSAVLCGSAKDDSDLYVFQPDVGVEEQRRPHRVVAEPSYFSPERDDPMEDGLQPESNIQFQSAQISGTSELPSPPIRMVGSPGRALPSRLLCDNPPSHYYGAERSIPASPGVGYSSETSSVASSPGPIVLQNDSQCFTYSIRRYVESMERGEGQEAEDESVYNNMLPLEVHGGGYQHMKMINNKNEEYKPGLIVKQLSLDVEHYIADTIKHHAEWGQRYIAFTDYDMQILEVCPTTCSVVVMVLALIQARTPKSTSSSRQMGKYIPRLYQTGFKFVWNLQTGSYNTVCIDDLEDIDQTQLYRRAWNPGHESSMRIQRQFLVPQCYSRSVHVMTNEAVFKGQSLKMLLDPQNYVAILLGTRP
ncbi:DDB1- and CUL4-associated factor 15 isoform X2 [Lingula anatina]|uniref:DDB1- and CUL4-associated factor 15 isoform X2 n=1 Tax=Lingula anatina TaxID=7574 RepID=A0A1S3JR75_LINAN|nr:DDB1- and CUL4-associated factor 15 isoform X2 [Lingula anatina]|eukprot:XP_013412885.1 DDB1- and CUL4-associated factor 15 isoform X2 [Lingula anatina]